MNDKKDLVKEFISCEVSWFNHFPPLHSSCDLIQIIAFVCGNDLGLITVENLSSILTIYPQNLTLFPRPRQREALFDFLKKHSIAFNLLKESIQAIKNHDLKCTAIPLELTENNAIEVRVDLKVFLDWFFDSGHEIHSSIAKEDLEKKLDTERERAISIEDEKKEHEKKLSVLDKKKLSKTEAHALIKERSWYLGTAIRYLYGKQSRANHYADSQDLRGEIATFYDEMKERLENLEKQSKEFRDIFIRIEKSNIFNDGIARYGVTRVKPKRFTAWAQKEYDYDFPLHLLITSRWQKSQKRIISFTNSNLPFIKTLWNGLCALRDSSR